jgi:hypothetical protein
VSAERKADPGYLLIVYLKDRDGTVRTVDIAFEGLQLLKKQLSAMKRPRARTFAPVLFDFKNERGDVLGVVSEFYLRHEVRAA